MIGLQLRLNEVQCALPKCPARYVEQHHRHQWRFAGLYQRQHLQHFIQRAESARAHHQSGRFLDEKQFARKEEVERQQV